MGFKKRSSQDKPDLNNDSFIPCSVTTAHNTVVYEFTVFIFILSVSGRIINLIK